MPFRRESVREFGVLQGFVATKLDLGREYKESFFAGVLPGSVSQPCALLSSSWGRGKADAWDVTLRFPEYLIETHLTYLLIFGQFLRAWKVEYPPM